MNTFNLMSLLSHSLVRQLVLSLRFLRSKVAQKSLRAEVVSRARWLIAVAPTCYFAGGLMSLAQRRINDILNNRATEDQIFTAFFKAPRKREMCYPNTFRDPSVPRKTAVKIWVYKRSYICLA
jgi:hypothetical protein